MRISPGRALDLDLNVHGAPNFRAPRIGDLNVFGVAQPRTQGLRAILSILRCRPNTPNPSHVVWFSTREEPIGQFSQIFYAQNVYSWYRLNVVLYVQFIYLVVPSYCEMLVNHAALSIFQIVQKTWKQLKQD